VGVLWAWRLLEFRVFPFADNIYGRYGRSSLLVSKIIVDSLFEGVGGGCRDWGLGIGKESLLIG